MKKISKIVIEYNTFKEITSLIRYYNIITTIVSVTSFCAAVYTFYIHHILLSIVLFVTSFIFINLLADAFNTTNNAEVEIVIEDVLDDIGYEDDAITIQQLEDMLLDEDKNKDK